MHANVVIVGGGPAGLSAATWLARYRRSVVIVDSGEYRNRWVEHMHGYLGSDPVDPEAFRTRVHEQLRQYGTVDIVQGRAVAAVRADDAFQVTLDDDTVVEAGRVILATGVRDVFPDIPGFLEHYGASVFHCPSCDGYEARDEPVVVFGWDAHVPGFAAGLLEWASSVTVVTDGRRFEGDDLHQRAMERLGIPIITDEVAELSGERGALRAVSLQSGAQLPASFAFFSIAHHPRTELAEALGCELTAEGCVVVDEHGRTSVPGVYAAGDMTPNSHVVQVAAAEGAAAGIAAAHALRDAVLGGHTGPHDRP